MGLKETWVDRIDGVDDADAEDINMVARAVIALEEANGDIDEALDRIIAIQNELLGIITFTIDGTEYTADKGMTWGEWVNSEYNTIGLIVDTEYNAIRPIGSSSTAVRGGELYLSVDADTVIESGFPYEIW
jgi:hypothetical protein